MKTHRANDLGMKLLGMSSWMHMSALQDIFFSRTQHEAAGHVKLNMAIMRLSANSVQPACVDKCHDSVSGHYQRLMCSMYGYL